MQCTALDVAFLLSVLHKFSGDSLLLRCGQVIRKKVGQMVSNNNNNIVMNTFVKHDFK